MAGSDIRLAVAIKPYPALRHFLRITTAHSPSMTAPITQGLPASSDLVGSDIRVIEGGVSDSNRASSFWRVHDHGPVRRVLSTHPAATLNHSSSRSFTVARCIRSPDLAHSRSRSGTGFGESTFTTNCHSHAVVRAGCHLRTARTFE